MASLPQSLELRESPNSSTERATWWANAVSVTSVARRFFERWIAVVLLLGSWELAPRLGLCEPTFFPPLSIVLQALGELVANGQLAKHLGASLFRSLVGLSIAISIAVPLGLAIGWSRRVSDAVSPLHEVFRNTAPLALLPVFILFFGIGELSKVALVLYACSWPILLNTIGGVRAVDPLLIKSARTMGVSTLGLLRKVILPAALPTVLVGIRLAGASSVLVLIAAEMVGAKAGLGYLIIYSQYNFQIPQMYAGIVATTAVGLTFARALLWIERRFTHVGGLSEE
jgi:NitT/TauT family transport system permease protein